MINVYKNTNDLDNITQENEQDNNKVTHSIILVQIYY